MGAILVQMTLIQSSLIPFKEISSVTVGDLPATFSYDKAEPCLAEISKDEKLTEGVSEVHYYNRWTKKLNEQKTKREIQIDLPESAIKPLFTNTFIEDTEKDNLNSPAFETLVIRIEYDIIGSYQGLQFVKTVAKDGLSIDVFILALAFSSLGV
jgi:hypothetical protein